MIDSDLGYGKPAKAAELSPAQIDAIDLAERRRPGRFEASPALVPLLRGEHTVPAVGAFDLPPLDGDWDDEDGMKPAKGIVFGIMLSLPLWAALLATCHVAIKLMTAS